MANGFCPSLLTTIEAVAGQNAPSRKLNVAGFLAMLFCCQNSSVNPVNSQFSNGHQRGLTVRYRQRPTLNDVTNEDDCAIDRVPSYSEWNIPSLNIVKSSFHIADDTISQYCEDASRTRQFGSPVTSVMLEIYDTILEHANVLLKAINRDLVTEAATQFGDNVTTGTSTGKVININEDGSKLILDNGIIDMMRDFQENEICGDPCIVGGGNFAAYNIAHAISCCNQAGLDMSRVGLPRFFFDKDTQDLWGANTVGAFSPGSVKFIGRNKFQGFRAGEKGTSFFTTFALPVNEFGCADDCLRDLIFDLQLKYHDCPFSDGYGSYDRGWQAIISKEYALWVQPDNAYASGDELFGTNGTLKYFVTNTSSAAASYAYP